MREKKNWRRPGFLNLAVQAGDKLNKREFVEVRPGEGGAWYDVLLQVVQRLGRHHLFLLAVRANEAQDIVLQACNTAPIHGLFISSI